MRKLCLYISEGFENLDELIEEIEDLGHKAIRSIEKDNNNEINYFIFENKSSFIKFNNDNSQYSHKLIIFLENKIVLYRDKSIGFLIEETDEDIIDNDLVIDAIISLSQDEESHQFKEIKIELNTSVDIEQELSEAEYNKIIYEWNKTDKPYPKNKTIYQLFQKQVDRTPNNIAVVFEEQELTYQVLNERSNQLARYLRSQTEIKPDTLIAICLDRSLEMIIGILGIMKTGGAYVPIDPEYPVERINYILENTQTKLILTQSHVSDSLKDITKQNKTKIGLIELDSTCIQDTKSTNLKVQNKSTDLAYVIYTSGTTGKPKGVMVEHNAVCNYVNNISTYFRFIKRVDYSSNLSFDLSITTALAPLILGKIIFIYNGGLSNTDKYLKHLDKNKIDFIKSTPSYLTQVRFEKISHRVNSCFIGGEKVNQNQIKYLSQYIHNIFDEYGPTEATVGTANILNNSGINSIGKVYNNYKAYVLDQNNSPVATGIIGELYIGGAGLARGYLNALELTEEKFIHNQFASTSDIAKGYIRLYKTGDLVRWLSNGNLEYVGREDDQVKIRGYRIELGEIESALLNIKGITQSSVLSAVNLINQSNDKYLVGYYVQDKGLAFNNLTPKYISGQLSKFLPDYMIPSILLEVDSFPLTLNGKLDKRKLLSLIQNEIDHFTYDTFTDSQKKIALIWQNLLPIQCEIKLADSFTGLGGHSLLITKLIQEINKTLGVYLTPKEIYQQNSLEDLDKYIGHKKCRQGTSDSITLPQKYITNGIETHQISAYQNSIYLADQINPGSYTIPVFVSADEILDTDVMVFAFKQLEYKYKILTGYIKEEDEILSHVLSGNKSDVYIKNINSKVELTKFIDEKSKINIDLNYKLVDFGIIQVEYLNTAYSIIDFSHHHIVADGYAIDLMVNDYFNLYHKLIKNPEYQSDLSYNYYEIASKIINNIPDDVKIVNIRPQNPLFTLPYINSTKEISCAKKISLDFSEIHKQRINEISKTNEVSINIVLLGLIYLVLFRLTSEKHINMGIVFSNRDKKNTVELLGCLINTLPFELEFNEKYINESFKSHLERIFSELNNLSEYSGVPLQELQKGNDNQDSINQGVFNFIFSSQFMNDEVDGLTIKKEFTNNEIPKFDIEFNFFHTEFPVALEINYDASKYVEYQIQNIFKSIESVLDSAIEKYTLSTIPIISDEEYKKIVYDWNQTGKDYPRDKTIYQLFQEQVTRKPNNIALVYEDKQLTYRELNAKSNQLARYIREQYKRDIKEELQPDTLIALCLDRSLEMMIGILAIMKAGGAYVPIDPEYPEERINYILEDTQTKVILTQSHLSDSLNDIVKQNKNKIDLIAVNSSCYQDQETTNLTVYGKSTNLAYVIYTSGTTGIPKGIMVEHKQLSSFILNFVNQPIITSLHNLNVLSLTNYVFDIFGLEFALPLSFGSCVYISDFTNINELHFRKSSIIQQTPIIMSSVCDNQKYSFIDKLCLVGGENLPFNIATKLLKSFKTVINVYGPAESVIWSSSYNLLSDEDVLIGKPLFNEMSYILDQNNQPVPIGVTGELHIGGVGLARGYLNNLELTNKKFIPNPFARKLDIEKGYTRLYKTGDLVRWLPNGNLEYIGRNDFQVKVRGYRIELAEIESALAGINGINQACVLAKENGSIDDGSSKYLVAYFVTENNIEIPQEIISKHLSSSLPDYMLPSYFVRLDIFPLTINGKLDRKALPDPEFISEDSYIAPNTDLEIKLCNIWQEILSLEKLGITDDFFRAGGNSILAIRLSHHINQSLDLHIAVADIFKYKTISSLISYLNSEDSDLLKQVKIIPQELRSYPLSFAQERLWFIEQYEQGTNAYHIPMLVELDKKTDIDKLKQVIKHIIQRHEILRTIFKQGETGNEEYIQLVLDEQLNINEYQYASSDEIRLKQQIDKDINIPFNLEKDFPIRVSLYYQNSIADKQNKKQITYLLINIHHIASDGWSLDILVSEIKELYQDKKLPNLRIQYKDFSCWQREYLQGKILKVQLSYWQEKLHGYEPLILSTDKPRPKQIDYVGDDIRFKINTSLSNKLRRLSKEQGCSMYTTLLSGFYILLNKYSSQDNIVLGAPIANRHYSEIQDLIGFFVNSLALRENINQEHTTADFISQVQQSLIEAQRHQDLPFEKIVEELKIEQDTSRHPIFQVMFGVQSFGSNLDNALTIFKSIESEKIRSIYSIAKYDLSCFMDDSKEEIAGTFNFAISLYNKITIERMVQHYLNILEQMISDEETKKIKDYNLLTKEEYQQTIIIWNKTDKKYPKDKTIYQLFQEQVTKKPNNIAVVYEDKQLTYRELNEKSNQLARYIREQYKTNTKNELEPDTLTAVCLDRSLEMIIGILGIMKAGGAYVPIDPEYPEERINYILEDTQTKMILTQSHLSGSLNVIVKQTKTKIDLIELDLIDYHGQESSNLAVSNKSTDLAYVIYTSGTTGGPKGVMVEHCNLASLLESQYFNRKFNKRTLWTNYTFDVSVFEVFSSLCSGSSLYIVNGETRLDAIKYFDYLNNNKIDTAYIPPFFIQSLSEYVKKYNGKVSLLNILTGVEKIYREDVLNILSNNISILNGYGPTETTVCSTALFIEGGVDEYEVLPIGKAINNESCYVLDKNLKPVPIGVVGELYIGGAGLARGYLNRSELTAEKFICNPFVSREGKVNDYKRLYKTGDLVRWLSDGNLEYIGRNDFQVKIRGYRIELGEIENVLASHTGIKQVVVLDKERVNSVNGQHKYIVAYYISDQVINDSAMVEYLNQSLPDYMVPSVFVRINNLPLTDNGKLDRKSLPDPQLKVSENIYVAPNTGLEFKLCDIWQKVLGLDRVGIKDEFFRIGGDSILSIQLSSQLRKVGLICSVKDIFYNKTVEKLAKHLALEKKVIEIYSEQGLLEGAFDLLPIQKWFFEKKASQQFKAYNHWNQSFLIVVPELEINMLTSCIKKLMFQHDMLAITYQKDLARGNDDKSSYQQIYHKKRNVPKLKTLDVSKVSNKLQANILTEWQNDFNIETGQLWQMGYLYGYKDGKARVYFALHHLIVDTVSWRILIDDLKALYQGEVLSDKTSSYRQWVAAAQLYAEKHQDEISYWQRQFTELPDYAAYRSQGKSISYTEDTLILDQSITKQLLQEANKAYNTEINDLLLTGLAYTLQDWQGAFIQGVTLEGHGREAIDEHIDISRTVGWFTTMYPVKLEIKQSLRESIKHIKESLRSIPNKGINYGALARQKDSVLNTASKLPPISFNYLGQFGSEEETWRLASEFSGISMHSDNQDYNLININGMVIGGEFRFNVVTQMSALQTKRITQSLKNHLVALTVHCQKVIDNEKQEHTPSDFPTVNISMMLLDDLQSEAKKTNNAIQAIYPVKNLQLAFIYHAITQKKDRAYYSHKIWDYHQPLCVNHYIEAWEIAIEKYPVLRTGFNWKEDIIQVVYRQGRLHYKVEDISNLSAGDKENRITKITGLLEDYDFTRPSLFRLNVIKQSKDLYTIILSEHHSIFDGWGSPILQNDIHNIYKALQHDQAVDKTEDLAYLQAQEYFYKYKMDIKAYWQHQKSIMKNTNDLNPLLSIRANLDEIKTPKIPKVIKFELKKELYHSIKAIGLKEGFTFSDVIQFIWHKLIQIYTQDNQTIVGTVISGRDIPINDITDSVGVYVNSLPLVINWDVNNTVLDQIKIIHKGIVELNANSYVELVNLQENGKPLFHSVIAFQNIPKLEIKDKNKKGFLVPFYKKVIYETASVLGIKAEDRQSGLGMMLEYDQSLMIDKKALSLVSNLEYLLEQVSTSITQPHFNLTLLSKEDYHRIIYDWNRIAKDYPRNKTIHCLFQEQVAKTPHQVALVFNDKQLTYQELNQRSNQLASYIRKQYQADQGGNKIFQSGTLICLCLDRSLELVISILGVLKAGGCYIPIDPNYPIERIQYILDDSKSKVLVTQKHVLENLSDTLKNQEHIQCITLNGGTYLDEPSQNLPEYSQPTDLAYVIYTSGTTGMPKGVLQPHENVMRLFTSSEHQFKFSCNDVWTLYHSYIFDFSVWELWGALIHGGKLFIPSYMQTRDMSNFYDLCLKEKVTVLCQTPSAFYQFANTVNKQSDDSLSLRLVIFGGEALNANKLSSWWEYAKFKQLSTKLINMYGITETTVHVTYKELSAEDITVMSNIGKPLADMQAYVLDQSLMPLPIGVTGELYVGGAGLAKGYLNRSELTVERFISNPFATEEDIAKGYNRLYKTGDLVKWQEDGSLEYISRNDFQVKIRGFRIELGEVEYALSSINGIDQTCVVVKERETELGFDKYLVGYYILSQDAVSENVDVIDGWEKLYDSEYQEFESFNNITSDFTGWNSYVTGQALPINEMEEWRNNTVLSIQKLNPCSVLEIGIGSGLLMYPLLEQNKISKYLGLDISSKVVARHKKYLKSLDYPVDLYHLTADRINELEASQLFNCIILNSVCQYFPSIQYLEDIITKAISKLEPEGYFFIGDIKDFNFHKDLVTAKFESQGVSFTNQDVESACLSENELLISPEYFLQLAAKLKGIKVDILEKDGAYCNELNQYRYDVVIKRSNKSYIDKHSYIIKEVKNVDQFEEDIANGEFDHIYVQQVENKRLSSGNSTENCVFSSIASRYEYSLKKYHFSEYGKFYISLLFSKSECYQSDLVRNIKKRSQYTYNIPFLSKLNKNDILLEMQKILPEYMVPSALVELASFPLTINGKLDIKSLPDPLTILDESTYVAPSTELELESCKIWQSVLGIVKVGINDDFFKIGGNSILAIQVANRMGELFNTTISVSDIFKYKTIHLIERGTYISNHQVIIPKCDLDRVPLSFAQERLWFIDQYEEGTNAYNIPIIFEVSEKLDLSVFQLSLQYLLGRHQILRTVFEQDEQGVNYQKILNHPLVILRRLNLSFNRFEMLLAEDANHVFNLKEEYPIRTVYYEFEDKTTKEIKRHILINIHHIAFDGWSADIFFKEIHQIYEANILNQELILPELPIQYKDFSVWQKEYLKGETLDQQLNYWRENLQGIESLTMPLDFQRPSKINYKGQHINFSIDKNLSMALRALSKKSGCTLYTILLGGFYILLHKYTGKNDIVVGTPIANRHYSQIENLIGFFVNSLAIRHTIKSTHTALEMIDIIHENLIDAQLHQDVPFEKLVDTLNIEKDQSRHPIFQIMFGLQNFGKTKSPYFKLSNLENNFNVSKFDIELFMSDHNEVIDGSLNYATALFKPETIEKMVEHYKIILDQLVEPDNKLIKDFQILSKDEYKTIVYDWNKTDKKYPKDKTIYQLFQEQVTRKPNNIAVVYEDKQLTYRELNAKSNQLARYIREQYKINTKNKLQPDALIAVCLGRSLEMIIGILGIMKAGAVYVPIDPEYPEERINYILEDTQTKMILTQSHLSGSLNVIVKQTKTKIDLIELDLIDYHGQESSNLAVSSKSTDLAYVIYTSGTTGKPKGVCLSHKSLNNLVINQINEFNIEEKDNILKFAALIFDASISEIFTSIISGACLNIIAEESRKSPELFLAYLIKNKINVATLPPAFLSILEYRELKELKTLVVAGEVCLESLMRKWSKGRKFINAYGPTESTVCATMHECFSGDIVTNIGKPLNNIKCYILDQNNQPVPIGVIGELHLGGDGLAAGYLNKPELTAQKFIPNPFVTEEDKKLSKKRLYKTGDLVKWLPDGNIEYIGRNDFQVKIRACRIELGEIENAFNSIEGIKQACVLTKEKISTKKHYESGNKYLVAYFITEKNIIMDKEIILNRLSHQLLDYMLPNVLIQLEKFPLTINGKLDRKALPEPQFMNIETYVVPSTDVEIKLCKIWESILDLDKVGITDDFFRIGGNSILAIQLVYQMNKLFKCSISIADLFRYKTIEALINNQKVQKECSLIKPFQTVLNKSKMFFIHPGYAGCEVYQDLSNMIDKDFHCVGIDNYNILFKNKISSLNEIAGKYIQELKQVYDFSSPIYLSGWSLGGQIALEMAYQLEQEGYREIYVNALDTILGDDNMLEFKVDEAQEQKFVTEMLKGKRLPGSYISEVISALEPERNIFSNKLSGKLKYTKINLFKASLMEEGANSKLRSYILNIEDNNIQSESESAISIIKINCHHWNILAEMVNEWSAYRAKFLHESKL